MEVNTIINRSMTAATIHASSYSGAMVIRGCGLYGQVDGPGTGDYHVAISVISPYVQLATDGKEPSLAPFSKAITATLRKACGVAHRAMHRPETGISIKDAAWSGMEAAYLKASGGGRYPANARQIMYAARPEILRLTRKDRLDDAYFTQTLLPDYVQEHGKTGWDVVFDSRGSFTEPHTAREVPLGTIDVRTYLGERRPVASGISLNHSAHFPTRGPEHRYAAVLFIEKEGFAPLLQTARIAERFDIAIMSTKGMSTTAARLLLDRLAPRIKKVLVLHDFDISGFSIFGTLCSDSRRYCFQNVLPVLDIGLRLDDVQAMDLQSEPVEIGGSWSKRAATLMEHGATRSEVDFLRTRRVELNAMPADVFIRFLERKLVEHAVKKVVPEDDVLQQHARNIIEQKLASKEFERIRLAVRAEADTTALPPELRNLVAEVLQQQPELAWDAALFQVLHFRHG